LHLLLCPTNTISSSFLSLIPIYVLAKTVVYVVNRSNHFNPTKKENIKLDVLDWINTSPSTRNENKQLKKIMIIMSDNANNVSPKNRKVQVLHYFLFRKIKAHFLIHVSYAEKMSKYNYVERVMSSLSKALSGVVDIQTFPYGNHLTSSGEIADDELAELNHHNALVTLSNILTTAIYNQRHPVVSFIAPNKQETPLSFFNLSHYSKFVDYFDTPSQLTPYKKLHVERIFKQIEIHGVFTPYSFTLRGCSPQGGGYCNGYDKENSVIKALLPFGLVFLSPIRSNSIWAKDEEYFPFKRLQDKDPATNKYILTELKGDSDPYPHVCSECPHRFCSSKVDTHHRLVHPSEREGDSQQQIDEMFAEEPVRHTAITASSKKVSHIQIFDTPRVHSTTKHVLK